MVDGDKAPAIANYRNPSNSIETTPGQSRCYGSSTRRSGVHASVDFHLTLGTSPDGQGGQDRLLEFIAEEDALSIPTGRGLLQYRGRAPCVRDLKVRHGGSRK